MAPVTKRLLAVAMALLMVSASIVFGGPAASAADADVVITEIMYDPPTDLDTDEFLEIHNSGGTTVDLTGWCVDGISFCFDPGVTIAGGEYLVVSPDAARSLSLYGVVTKGTYTGGLKNGGEELQLLDAFANVIHSVDYDDRHPWPVTPDGQGPSLELISIDADRSNPWNWAASEAFVGHTAGAANSIAATGMPPQFGAVTNSNDAPADGEAIVVTAEVTGSATTPVLSWRVNMGSFSNITMVNAGGNTWSATIPGQNTGELVDYRIQATGSFDHTYPRHDAGSTTTGVYYPKTIATNIPVFEWFINDADYTSMITDHLEDDRLFPMGLVVGTEVITDARVRVRGSSSVFDPKVNFKFEMPRGHDLELPALLVEPVDEFAIQAEYSDRAYGRSILTWTTYEMADIPVPQIFKVRVQRNGSFQGLYNYMDTFDKTWREREGFQDDGALYKAKTGAYSVNRDVAKRWDQKSGVDDGLQSLDEMIGFVLDPDAEVREAYVREHFDVASIVNYAAVTAIMHHVDSSSKNFYAYQDYGTGRWSIIPWDLDHTIGNTCTCNVFSDFITPAEPGDKTNAMVAAVLEVDEFEQMYFRRLRSLIDDIFAPGVLEGIFDTKIVPADQEAGLDKLMWGQCCQVFQERLWLFDDIQERRDLFEADPRVPASQAATPDVTITEIFANAGDPATEYVELFNPSATTAVDISGWSISDGIDLVVPNGTVIPPLTPMAFVADDLGFGAAHGRTLFVGGTYSGDLDPAGELLTLVRHDLSVADVVDYSGIDFPAPVVDDSIELAGQGFDNSVGANWSPVTGGTPSFFDGLGGVPIVPNAPLVPFPPVDPPAPFRCTATISGADMVISLTGDRGTREQLRNAGGSWIATVTGAASYTVVGGAGGEFEIRIKGPEFEIPYSTIPCIGAGGPPDPPDPPDPTPYTCTASVDGADMVLSFAGDRGSSENVRRVGARWVATVTGQESHTVTGGAGDSFEVRVRGIDFDDPYSVIVCM